MDSFTTLTAVAAPLRWADINTDDIFPGPAASPILRQHGNRDVATDKSKMGTNAFAAQRWTADGRRNDDFILNQPPYDRAGILIAGANFGCGSLREMAVWALAGLGIRCIIAPSFGDIFYSNCSKNGMLPIRLSETDVEALMSLAESSAEPLFHVDLLACEVTAPDASRRTFEIGSYQRHALLNGLDEIAATLERLPEIETHEAAYLARRPWLKTTA